ncbi:MAG: tetratricopeptide repeat protein [Bradymonadaceae bacterium]
MDVECPQCRTVYEVDESRLPSDEATFQCQNCDHLFKLGADASADREDQRRWMVREPGGGEILYFSRFDTLHGWILDRRVDQGWELSRTGKKWTTLGDIAEFRPIFEVVDSVSDLEGDRAVEETPGERRRSSERSRSKTLSQFDEDEERPGGRSEPSGAADQPPPGSASAQASTDTSFPSPSTRSSELSAESEQPEPDQPAGGELASAEPSPVEGAEAGGAPESSRSPSGGPESAGERTEEPSGSTSTSAPGPDSGAGTPETTGSGASPESGGEPTSTPSGESDQVQLESGRFGSQTGARTSPESDDWEFDGEVDLESPPAGEDEVDYASEVGAGGRRWSVVAGVALSFIVLGGAVFGYLYLYQRATLQRWASALRVAGSDRSGADAGAGADAGEPELSPRRAALKAVGGARDAADGAVREAVEKRVERAGAAAGKKVASAVAESVSSSERAAKALSGRSIDDLIAEADSALNSGRSGRARNLYRKALEADPSNPSALSGMGWTYLNAGSPQRAIDHFRRALDAAPGFGDAYIGLGTAYRQVGKLQKALEAYENYLSAHPNGRKASIARHQRDQLRSTLGMD